MSGPDSSTFLSCLLYKKKELGVLLSLIQCAPNICHWYRYVSLCCKINLISTTPDYKEDLKHYNLPICFSMKSVNLSIQHMSTGEF